MGAEQVIEKILADAREQAEKVLNQAKESQSGEDAKSEQQLQEYRRQTDALAEKAAKAEQSHILSAARMENARLYLAEKTKILKEVFDSARQQLRSLPDHEFWPLMMRLMTSAVEAGDEQVIVDKNEGRINWDFVNQANRQLGSSGKGRLSLSDERQGIEGGFILKRGKIKTNVSLGVLLDQARRQLEIELAKELFS